MKSFLKVLAAGVLIFTVSDAVAQTRDFGAERLLLDDGAGTGILTIEYAGPGDSQLIIPPGPATTVQPGNLAGQTLRWDGTAWLTSGVLMNDGTDVSIPTGNLTLGAGAISGNGSGLTDLNADNISTGALSLDRISTTGGADGLAITYSAGSLFYGTPTAGALTMPFNQTSSIGGFGNYMFNLTNLGLGGAAYFEVSENASTDAVVRAVTNGAVQSVALLGINNGFGSGVSGSATSGPGVRGFGTAGVYGNGFVAGVEGEGINTAQGVLGHSVDGEGVMGTSTNNRGVSGESVINNGVAGLSQATGAAGVAGVNTGGGTGISGVAFGGTGGHFVGLMGVLIADGALVASYEDVDDAGAISIDKVTVLINDNTGPTAPNVTLAGGMANGQIMIVCTNDPHGATINGSINVTTCVTLVYMAGAWRSQ